MSQTPRTDNPNGLDTLEDVLAAQGLTLISEDVEPPTMPSWVGGKGATPMPSALVEELAGLHAQEHAAEQSAAEIKARRETLFRGFLIGAGMSLAAIYDLSTGHISVPEQE